MAYRQIQKAVIITNDKQKNNSSTNFSLFLHIHSISALYLLPHYAGKIKNKIGFLVITDKAKRQIAVGKASAISAKCAQAANHKKYNKRSARPMCQRHVKGIFIEKADPTSLTKMRKKSHHHDHHIRPRRIDRDGPCSFVKRMPIV